MTLRLRSFQFLSESPERWSSQKITFANQFSFIRGENGAGKTPMMRGIAFAMGYPVELPPHISQNCDRAILALSFHGIDWTIDRPLSGPFSISVIDQDGKVTTFTGERSERQFSDWFFEQLKISLPTITTKQQAGAKPYLGNVMPLFWISQSKGWQHVYQPLNTQNYISSQREEMLRLIFDLPPKKPFDRNKAYEEKKKDLEIILDLIAIRKASLTRMRAGLESPKDLPEPLQMEKDRIKEQLEIARKQLESNSQSTFHLDREIEDRRKKKYALETSLRDLQGRTRGLEMAYAELDGETEIVESNEVATDAFREFCGVDGCKIFEPARQTYGKRLLYLRDQLKDIASSKNSMQMQIEETQKGIKEESEMIVVLENEKQIVLQASGTKEIFNSIDRLGKNYSAMDRRLEAAKNYAEVRANFASLIEEKENLVDAVKALKPGAANQDKTRLLDVVDTFGKALIEWLKILKTPNLSSLQPIIFNEDFSISFNGVVFSEDSFQDGSTRARIVLAHYAAYLDTSIRVGGKHPRVLFLDTPKQQEIEPEHLKNYFDELRTRLLNGDSAAQIVVACKDEITPKFDDDLEYFPNFLFDDGLRYLGPDEKISGAVNESSVPGAAEVTST